MLLLFFLCLGLLNPTSLIGCLRPEHIKKGGPRPAAQLLKSQGSLVQKSQGLRQRPGLGGDKEDREGGGEGEMSDACSLPLAELNLSSAANGVHSVCREE